MLPFAGIRSHIVRIIGTGKAAEFNIRAVAKVAGPYHFDVANEPRHRRRVQLRTLAEPLSFSQWAWAKRIHELQRGKMSELVEVVDCGIFGL